MFEYAMTYREFKKLSTQEQNEIFKQGYAIWFCVACKEPTLHKEGRSSRNPKSPNPVDTCTICGHEHVRGKKH